ncbi:uncharacterized protein CC84DRAFT_271444 [Paraphaeosphaeria sporulosa]|uniref:Uncharacterized protein n=1 Tax=Paraphaeosphaeria sporulosa TaxID=1460663 RepID=A0A177C113_9PLEO|nr:uncharacterized protein CC84DRAFT_271444 [Paraphaeosphaeria sporulosa]OAG00901.1 hypothetical protein CC84DRAFT_271444 [Paraphaeosphaeria sporulosa]
MRHGFAVAGQEDDHCQERGDTNTAVMEMRRVKESEEEGNRGARQYGRPQPAPVPVAGLAGFAQRLARSISGDVIDDFPINAARLPCMSVLSHGSPYTTLITLLLGIAYAYLAGALASSSSFSVLCAGIVSTCLSCRMGSCTLRAASGYSPGQRRFCSHIEKPNCAWRNWPTTSSPPSTDSRRPVLQLVSLTNACPIASKLHCACELPAEL